MNYPYGISDYHEKHKKHIALAIKIIDNEGDPNWCFRNNKLAYCSNDAYNVVVLEYKRRIMIQLNELFKKKKIGQIRKLIKGSRFKNKIAALTYLHKYSWEKLREFLKESKQWKHKTRRRRRKTRRTRRKTRR